MARPIRERRDLDATTLLHHYDAMGRRRELRLERDGEDVGDWAYDYDGDGRISAVADPAGGRTEDKLREAIFVFVKPPLRNDFVAGACPEHSRRGSSQ